ncbi:hypothetical protein V6N12_063890 [Hibiscus sabdariffa]|uniref:NAC domain-containing protein n=1 Tax=Hibiscus sabdariffa TaxID=183260 RepID=A0ABR2ASK6_9ROSI
MGLRDIGATLPPGFRFYPSDEELVCHYLYKKIANEEVLKGTLVEIDLHTCEPWQLPEVAKLNAKEWYFFSFRDRKYATGFRTNRATTSGYWKATGKDRTVIDPITQEVVGMRKTLVFYMNRAPNGIKTSWIMHEFRLESPHMPPKEDWVLCRVFHKSKAGENSTEMSPHMMYEASTQTSMACGGYQQISCSLSATPTHQPPHGQSLLNLLHSSQLKSNDNSFSNYEVSSKVVPDDYEFLWDMNMEENSLGDHHVQGHGVADSNLEDIRFEIDNSMIVL